MKLPVQSRPVERTITGQPWGNRSAGSSAAHGQGVEPSGQGVDASGFNFGSLLNNLPNLISTIGSFF